ncbi:coenzyme F420 biosynthesis-associated protein [Carbonactinospora thermoautotrophica]|uniref:Coenzyme F420 biosynthesis-associated protein n=1 Tax=Carbonactinospora thermoautotrophica TaxID=1469144 RepID=A0A132MK19_9ACTN|nr:zinc-dependent metalloprotease [Carbonactinospora thermoautotrophica]KWW98200.1 coenzyme F420 biosynthesis-associated protein [Carbonactinospora thermoautotrophica]KWX10406.1 coenzyme F420 biosynthesis-associated protein [Carbonactinospora thermoautotrophica]
MIDWDLVTATSERLMRPGPQVTLDEARAVVAELRQYAATAERHVSEFTGLTAPSGSGPVLVVNRSNWVRANVDGFRVILRPLLDKIEARRVSIPGGELLSAIGAKVTGFELGAALAFLAGKVLGQYEMFARTSDGSGGRLLLVAPNVVQAERDMAVDPRDFRLWVCLHEETHRVQFTSVPWLREHLESEIEAFLAQTDVDPAALLGRVRDAVRALTDDRRRAQADEETEPLSLFDLVQTREQRVILNRLTALMSLLEGHAEYVMDGVGPAVIPSVTEIREKFQQRRTNVSRIDAMVRRLLGMDLKLRQYREGERFVRTVVDRVGMSGFNRVWTSPNTLPSKQEIADPDAWVTRVHGRSALEG